MVLARGAVVRCLECWRTLWPDFLHLDCTGEHFVPEAEADEIREWITGRYWFMVGTGQRVLT
jgi:hypothetical protein